MYASALPAGNFRGIGAAARVVRHNPLPSRDGSRAAQHATNLALRQVGIQGLRGLSGGLGDVDMCNDPGWRFAQGLIAGAGSVISQAGARDQGWAAAGGATSAVGQAWANACASGATTAAQPGETLADVYARAQMQMQMQVAAQRQADMNLQVERERREAAARQQTNTYLLIGGGVLAVAAVAAFIRFGR